MSTPAERDLFHALDNTYRNGDSRAPLKPNALVKLQIRRALEHLKGVDMAFPKKAMISRIGSAKEALWVISR